MMNLLADEQVWAYSRSGLNCSAVVVFNSDAKPVRVSFPVAGVSLPEGTVSDALGAADARFERGVLTAELPPRQAALYLAPLR